MPGKLSTIQEFKAEMKKGFARPNIFGVTVSPIVSLGFQKRFQLACFQAQIPGSNIATTDKDIGFRSVAYQKIFSDVILGFYVGGDLRELRFWQDWIDTIIDNQTNVHAYYKDYVGNVQITQGNRQQKPVAKWTLHDAYPKQVDPVQLDYGSNDAVMTCNVTITYRYHDVIWYPSDGSEPGSHALYSNNTRTDLNKVDPMGEIRDPKENWKFRDGPVDMSIFPKMFPTWGTDKMSFQEQESILRRYGVERSSPSGGARHSVPEPTAD